MNYCARNVRQTIALLNRNKMSTLTGHSVKEVEIPVPFGHIAGRFWNENGSKTPILACHGWMDNAGTWDGLIPLLNKDFPVLAIDFHGHGLSSPFPAGLGILHINNALTLHYIVEFFQWKKVMLLGHSMGAGVSFLYAGTKPEVVEKFINMDGFLPLSTKPEEQPDKTAMAFKQMIELQNRSTESPQYEYDEMVDKMTASYRGSTTRESTHILLKRGSKQNEDGSYSFNYSPNIKTTSILSLTKEHTLAFTERIRCPLLFIKAMPLSFPLDNSYALKVLDMFKSNLGDDFVFKEVSGTHHVHLNNPQSISQYINDFLLGNQMQSDDYHSFLSKI